MINPGSLNRIFFSSISSRFSQNMSTKLYIGNLAWRTNTDSLKDAFSAYGQVQDAIVMIDRESGRSRGFGFVTFATEEEAKNAVENMNGRDLEGRNIRVDIAAARQERSEPRSFGGYNRERREY
jgi:RNA recognition motif-containing protein